MLYNSYTGIPNFRIITQDVIALILSNDHTVACILISNKLRICMPSLSISHPKVMLSEGMCMCSLFGDLWGLHGVHG